VQQVRRGPTTHISSLANLHQAFCIQMVNPYDLRDSLDASTDLRPDLGDTMEETFPVLLKKKYENCSDWFTTNLATLGIQEPLVVIIYSDGAWQMDEGHHRLAWALLHNVDVPVIFDDSGADDESHMGFLVSRASVDAYHHTIADDLLLVDDVETSFPDTPETGAFLAQSPAEVKGDHVFIPAPAGEGGRHRAGGRHRSQF
jgi:hypothetical protein